MVIVVHGLYDVEGVLLLLLVANLEVILDDNGDLADDDGEVVEDRITGILLQPL